MTFWYAPASAVASLQTLASFLPAAPPKDTTTSPPALRIALIRLTMAEPCRLPEPSQAGLQPPSERMKARVNALIPAVFMTVTGFGFLLVAGKMYGVPPSATAFGATIAGAADPVAAWLIVMPPTANAATTTAVPLTRRSGRTLMVPPSPDRDVRPSARIVPCSRPDRKAS